MNLYTFKSINQVFTRYLDNQDNLNLTIDLMFLRPNSSEPDNHTIYSEQRLSSDHASLTVNIVIFKEYIQTKKCIIIKNSEKEKNFTTELIKAIKRIYTDNITSKEVFKQIIHEFANNMDRIWFKNSKIVNITKYSKSWWNKECNRGLERYQALKHVKD